MYVSYKIITRITISYYLHLFCLFQRVIILLIRIRIIEIEEMNRIRFLICRIFNNFFSKFKLVKIYYSHKKKPKNAEKLIFLH